MRRVTKAIRHEMRRRAAIEPVIGHVDRINAVLAAAGYNFSLLLRWLERLLRALLVTLYRSRNSGFA